ncbi:MAG: helix-turn-helix domain-containing protein [SAR324 cluster bacterium]|nr:helix-turn-helix domain-containing protein [SAR324 cluster bacterium]
MKKLFRATDDTGVSYNDLLVMIYGKENPLLDQKIFKGVGGVTREIAANPIYSVMRDQLEKKAILEGLIDPDRDFAHYTMTTSQAARQLGVHETAVVKAVQQHRLTGRKINGQWRLHPTAVAGYKVQTKKSKNAGRRAG